MINTEILSKYGDLPYNIIGLDLTNNSNLELLNHEEPFSFKQIFNDINNCKEFLVNRQVNNDIIILIICGHLSSDQLKTLEKYSQIDAIYLYSVSDDHKKDLKCIYTKTTNSNYYETFINLLKRLWFLLGLGVVIILAYIYPPLGSTGGPLFPEYTIKRGGVAVISFFSGLAIPMKTLAHELLHIRLHIFVQGYSLVLIPFTVYGVCLLLVHTSLNKVLIAGILTTSCQSTTISSIIVMTKNAGGNQSAAVVNSILGTILGVFISPALIWLFMLNDDINVLKKSFDMNTYLHVLIILGLTVLLPVIIGQIIHYLWPERVNYAQEKFYFSEINNIVLLLLLYSVLCDLFESGALSTVNKIDLIIVILLNATFYITFSLLALYLARLPNLLICRKEKLNHDKQPLLLESDKKAKSCIEHWRFSREDTIAIMFCAAMKTASKGITLINSMNSASDQGFISLLSIPLILNYVEQLILSAIQVILLQNWLKSKYDDNHKELIEE